MAHPYTLRLRITEESSPTSGQPNAGGVGAGKVIDLRQWVAERMVIDPVEPAPKPAPVVVTPAPAVVAPKPVPQITTTTTSAPTPSIGSGFRENG